MMKIPDILFLLFFVCFASSLHSQSLTVATYNMRYSIEENYLKDSLNGEDWKRRGPVVAALVRFHDFDIFGTQECLLHQLEDLSDWLPAHRYVGVGRDDGKQAGEYTAIFYKTDRFKVLKKGDFWLSETPDTPSLGWDATCCHRICSWVYFEDLESNDQFYFFNTHFDHQGIQARIESSKLVLAKIEEIAGDKPVILMGDLNGDHDSEWYQTLSDSDLLTDTYNQVEEPYANNGSYNGFGKRNFDKRIIDHVFTSPHIQAEKWGILTDTYHGKFPSDHFTVMVKLKMVKQLRTNE